MLISYIVTGDMERPRISIVKLQWFDKVGKKAFKDVNLTFVYYHVNHLVSECLPWNE